ncbi:ABC transporter permease [Tsukamurella strandjordii]|uniref:ABC transporter permease n=1 Tax=Tsukamurella strandjordii TaxID=147577 RepID=UPI0031D591F7
MTAPGPGATAPAAPSLNRTVAQMQWTLYKRRSSGGRLALNILAGVFAALVAIALVVGSVAIGISGDPAGGAWMAVVLAGIGAMWAYLPALSGFSDSGLQPRQFTLLPLRPRPFARALFLSSLIGIPVPVTVLACCLILGYAAGRAPVTLLVAIPAVPLTALLFVALSRVISLGLSQAIRSRRGRELAMLAFVLVFCVLYAGQFVLNQRLGETFDAGGPRGAYAIPFAWGIAAVERAAEGQWSIAIGALIGLAALSGLLLLAWQALVARLFDGRVAPSTSERSARSRSGYLRQGWRATPRGAVVARELAAWRGDVRRLYQLLPTLAFGAMSAVMPLFLPDFPFNARWGAYFVLMMATMGAMNLYGLDGKTFWHLAMVPSAASADVRGRQIAWALVTLPIAVVAAVVVRAFGDDPWDRVEVPIAVTVAMLGVGAGLMIAGSASAPYPVPDAKKMMSFSTRNSAGGAAIGWSLGSIGILAVTAVPCALLAALLPAPLRWTGIALAAVLGALGWWWGGRIATGRLITRPDLIQYAVTRN